MHSEFAFMSVCLYF